MKKICLVIFLLLPFTVSWAVNIADMYKVEIPVVTQSSDERAEASKIGFERVLLRLTGNPDIEKNPVIKSALKKPDYFVEEFSYSASPQAKQSEDDVLPESSELSSSQYFIHLRYSRADVDRLLQKAGVARWEGARPLVLAWIIYRGNNHSVQIVGSETADLILGPIKQNANYYGLPLIFPMMDMADMSIVSVQDVRNQFLPVLKEAGKRYQPDAYLLGSISEEGHEFKSEWMLVAGDQRWGWSLTDKSMDQLSGAVVKEVMQALSKNAIAAVISKSPGQWIKVSVFNINADDDLAQLTQYLKQMADVQQIQLSEVSDGVVDLSILIRGKLDDFQKNAVTNKRLVFKADDSADDKLVYEWVR